MQTSVRPARRRSWHSVALDQERTQATKMIPRRDETERQVWALGGSDLVPSDEWATRPTELRRAIDCSVRASGRREGDARRPCNRLHSGRGRRRRSTKGAMPTMADVAARAGVSVATVSRALSGDPTRVSAPVLQRIIDAAEELEYIPNNLARNMRSGSSRILGLIISDIGNPFFTAVARGVEDVAQRHGYSLVLSNTDENPEREAASLGVMAAERAAGLIIATTNENGTALRRFQDMGMAIVAIDRHIVDLPTDSVVVDNESAVLRSGHAPRAARPPAHRHRGRAERRRHGARAAARLRAGAPGGQDQPRARARLPRGFPRGRGAHHDPRAARPAGAAQRHLRGQQPDHHRRARRPARARGRRALGDVRRGLR